MYNLYILLKKAYIDNDIKKKIKSVKRQEKKNVRILRQINVILIRYSSGFVVNILTYNNNKYINTQSNSFLIIIYYERNTILL